MGTKFSAENVERLIAASRHTKCLSQSPNTCCANTIAELKSLIHKSNSLLSAVKTQLLEVQESHAKTKTAHKDEIDSTSVSSRTPSPSKSDELLSEDDPGPDLLFLGKQEDKSAFVPSPPLLRSKSCGKEAKHLSFSC